MWSVEPRKHRLCREVIYLKSCSRRPFLLAGSDDNENCSASWDMHGTAWDILWEYSHNSCTLLYEALWEEGRAAGNALPVHSHLDNDRMLAEMPKKYIILYHWANLNTAMLFIYHRTQSCWPPPWYWTVWSVTVRSVKSTAFIQRFSNQWPLKAL